MPLVQVIAYFQRPKETLRPRGMCLVETWDLASWSTTLKTLFAECGCEVFGSGRLLKWTAGAHGKSLWAAKSPELAAVRALLPVMKVIPGRAACPYFVG